jgi:hypothetical protein
MNFSKSVEGKTRIRIGIRNGKFRKEVGIQNLFIMPEVKWLQWLSPMEKIGRTRIQRRECEAEGCVGWPMYSKTSRAGETAGEEMEGKKEERENCVEQKCARTRIRRIPPILLILDQTFSVMCPVMIDLKSNCNVADLRTQRF